MSSAYSHIMPQEQSNWVPVVFDCAKADSTAAAEACIEPDCACHAVTPSIIIIQSYTASTFTGILRKNQFPT